MRYNIPSFGGERQKTVLEQQLKKKTIKKDYKFWCRKEETSSTSHPD